MSNKALAVIAVLAVLASGGWYFRDTELLRGAATSVEGFVKNTLPGNSATGVKAKGAKPAGKDDPSKSAHVLRKCVSEKKTVYTDEACPPGSHEAPISDGSVTVVPTQRPAGTTNSKDDVKSRGKHGE